jgi:diguanylate cyclase (GGDEF)-like protein
MGLSVSELSLIAVELLVAFALAALWFSDRERTYTLWWAISHVILPVPTLLMAGGNANSLYSPLIAGLLFLNVAVQSTTLVAGVISYRLQRQLRVRLVVLAIIGMWLLFTLPMFVFGLLWPRLSLVLAMIVALLASAVMMWSLGRFERVAAVCFLLRCSFHSVLLAMVLIDDTNSPWFKHTPGFSGFMGVATALALLLAAYQRSLDRLRDQHRLLELSYAITAQLQGAGSDASLMEKVLAEIGKQLGWEQGVFLRPMKETHVYMAIASYGRPVEDLNLGEPFAVSDNSFIPVSLKTRRVSFTNNLADDPLVSARYRQHPSIANNSSLAIVPVVHGNAGLGVIMLRDSRRREFSAAEILTLENLGQVIGIGLANADNLSELAYRANHDTLTGLGNRAALHDYLSSLTTECYAVLLFDLDHFKQVNDVLGHSVGDRLLQALAQRLQLHLAACPAALFRLGGDEFVIIHAYTGSSSARAQAEAFATELAEVIAQSLVVGDLSLRTPASIGVALAPEQGASSHELLRCADVAMYHAKNSGSGVAFYGREIDAYKLEHLTLLSAVAGGLEQKQFTLHYQPLIDMATGAVAGCEALIRWHHPTRGLVSAAEFMPLVETTDMIRALTYQVIEMAMTDAGRWRRRGIDSYIAINLSARNILDPELLPHLLRTAMEHSIEPSRIQLEITETILIKDPVSAIQALEQLVAAGFTLALDDFGTGYSSLAYLARFPIHTLKIDRSFVSEMLTHPQSRAIVESTIALARGLGLKVTAEGVEQEAEAQLLRELGCDYAQGYFVQQADTGRSIDGGVVGRIFQPPYSNFSI